jgi:nickel/cobalt transporter (NicO) family protein
VWCPTANSSAASSASFRRADHIDTVLLGTAASIGFLHTILGVDHSLPFVVLGRAEGWSLRRTLGIAGLCGVAHVLSSVAIGVLGIGLGFAVDDLIGIEAARGDFVAWALIAFGLTYAVWALIRAERKRRHEHAHAHHDGTLHKHEHDHQREHLHAHATPRKATFWTLFLLFAFGPCEALIPVLMAPAWAMDWALVVGVVALFGGITVLTMLGSVAAIWRGLDLAALKRLGFERWAEPLAGGVVAASGGLILLGL